MAQLGIQALNLVDINHYSPTTYVNMTSGQDFNFYFRLVDLSQQCSNQAFPTPYTPNAAPLKSATGSVLYASLNSTSTINATLMGITKNQVWTGTDTGTVLALAAQFNTDTNTSQFIFASTLGDTFIFTASSGFGALGNSFTYGGGITGGAGSATPAGGFLTGGSGAGSASLQCQVLNINDALVITRYATQPFATLDPSIWLLQLLNTDPIPPGTANFRVTLTENTTQSFAYAQGLFRVQGTTQGLTQPGDTSGPHNTPVNIGQ